MILDEKLRWYGFWFVDGLKGGKVRKYYQEIKRKLSKGNSDRQNRRKNQKAHRSRSADNRVL